MRRGIVAPRPEVAPRASPALDLDRDQVARLDELPDTGARVGEAEPEVVAQVALGGHAHRAGRDSDQLALGVLGRRRGRGDHLRRQHPLGQVVEALEVPPPRRADLAGPEEPLDGALRIGPVPPGPGSLGASLGELGGGDRPPVADLLEDPLHQVRTLVADPEHPAPCLGVGTLHAPAKQRLKRDREERRLVAPVLEKAPGGPVGGVVERGARVGAQAGESGQVVRALQDVHRVHLHHADVREEPPDSPTR